MVSSVLKLLLFWSVLVASLGLNAAVGADNYLVYVGTYGSGIKAYRYDPASKEVLELGQVSDIPNPSFLTLHPNKKILYAVSEMNAKNFPGGAVTAFAINPQNGKLTELNAVSSVGKGPCHVIVDHSGKLLMIANYGSGSMIAYNLDAAGKIIATNKVFQHEGSSVNKSRQSGPHAHQVELAADNRYAFVPDLGLDQIRAYRVKAAELSVAPAQPPFVSTPAGSGPRHMVFHTNGKFAYVVSELKSEVTTYTYRGASGDLHATSTAATIPPTVTKTNYPAELAVGRGGRFLYVSNRGDNSLALFSINQMNGSLTLIETTPVEGQWPRHFAIDPGGKTLFAANQKSHQVVLFDVNPQTGKLKPNGKTLNVSSPACVLFLAQR